MKLFKSPWLYTLIAIFVFWFTPIGRMYDNEIAGFAQRELGATNGKQLAFLLLVIMLIPIILVYMLSKKLLKSR